MREDGRGENIWGVFSHTLALDPLCLGEEYEKPDFIGLNLYQGAPVRAGENGPETLPFPAGFPRAALGWPITPEALEWGPRFLAERYRLRPPPCPAFPARRGNLRRAVLCALAEMGFHNRGKHGFFPAKSRKVLAKYMHK